MIYSPIALGIQPQKLAADCDAEKERRKQYRQLYYQRVEMKKKTKRLDKKEKKG